MTQILDNTGSDQQQMMDPESLIDQLVEANKEAARQYLEKANNLTAMKLSVDWESMTQEQKEAWVAVLTG